MRTELLLLAALTLGACKKDDAAPHAAVPVKPPVANDTAAVSPPPAEEVVWSVSFDFEAPLPAGKPITALITIAAMPGFHVNADYPLSLKVSGADNLKLDGERVQLAASEKTPCKDEPTESCEVKVPLTLTAEAAGVASFDGVLSFSVCSADKCLTPKEALRLVADAI